MWKDCLGGLLVLPGESGMAEYLLGLGGLVGCSASPGEGMRGRGCACIEWPAISLCGRLPGGGCRVDWMAWAWKKPVAINSL